MSNSLKRILIGKAIKTKHAHHEALPKRFALPIFASDALSSTAYATEEIMRVFMIASAAYLGFTTSIAIAISVLIFIVATSYWQTIFAYPKGGGSYIVTRDNIGSTWGRLSGASLMMDYILTVSVSVSAGVLALISLLPQTAPYAVPIGVAAVSLLTLANLRGAKESGILFAIPTYTYVVLLAVVIVVGIFFRGAAPIPQVVLDAKLLNESKPDMQASLMNLMFLTVFFKAFSSGCAAMTGIEAISDGAGAFKEPTAKNASMTLMIMATLLSGLFIGSSYIAEKFHIIPYVPVPGGHEEPHKTVLAMLCNHVFPLDSMFGNGFFWALQIATAGILFLAANTAYADFPRLCSFIARDGFLPRQLANQGDRLVFQNGILVLSVSAVLLLIKFGGDTHALIPLYAVGVFLSFTLSQFGMVARAKNLKSVNAGTFISAFGGVVTLIITLVLFVSKFHDGAWLIMFAIGFLMLIFFLIRRHYDYLAKELEVQPGDEAVKMQTTALLLVPKVHRGILQAISYAEALTDDVRAIHVTINPATVPAVKESWIKFGKDMPLVILESPFRSLVDPIVEYIDQTLEENPNLFITVIVPEAVAKKWYHKILHNNVGVALKMALGRRKNVAVTNVRYFLK